MKDTLSGPVSTVEGFFDQIRMRYKWRFNRWKHPRIQTYRGYGTSEELHLKGRVLDDKGITPSADQPRWKNAIDTLRRIESDEIPGASVQLRFEDQVLETQSGEDGFFTFSFPPSKPLPQDRIWHEVTLDLLRPEPDAPEDVRTTARIEVPPSDAEFGVISDLDDTVIRTGATSLFHMMRVVLLNNPHTRAPFEGVGALYKALQKGPDGRGHNPIFYLSSSPWNLYELFQGFFEAHNIPAGPIFLKDYGFAKDKFFNTGHKTHKLSHIDHLMTIYPDLPFVLIGDSGQKDAEIYYEAAQKHGAERIAAIYIRDVTPTRRDRRDEAVEKIAQEVNDSGVPMLLVEDSVTAAEHAAARSLIPEEHVDEVRKDRHREQEEHEEPGLLEKILG